MNKETLLDVYYWPTPNGKKVTILLEELGLDYDIIPIDITTGAQFEANFLKISPNNRIPAVVDHETGVSLFESGAIMLYLAEKTGQFIPSDTHAHADALQWLFWQMGGLGPMSGQAGHFLKYADEKIPYAMQRYTNEVNRLYGVMNTQLAERDYLAKTYSIADIACWPWVACYENYNQDLNQFPHLKAWFERIGKRPAVQKGNSIGNDLAKDITSEEARKILFNQKSDNES